MKKISLSELISLPEKNQQEAERMFSNYEKHIKEFADHKEQLKVQAIRKKVTDLHGGGDGNVSAT
jgi:hypothetical protein